MSVDVAVIDYGIGNVLSVCRALEHCGARVVVSDDPHVLLSAPRLVLPGVGAFADGMRGLIDRRLDQIVLEYADMGHPLLGICLGMQMFASASEEFGNHDGLGLIPGQVVAIPGTGVDGRTHKIPHVGWSSLELPAGHFRSGWDGSILGGVEPGASVYMVHSYTVIPDEDGHRLANCHYNGRIIAAVIGNRNVVGCQFHPEKSGVIGLTILKAFLTSKIP